MPEPALLVIAGALLGALLACVLILIMSLAVESQRLVVTVRWSPQPCEDHDVGDQDDVELEAAEGAV